MIRVGDDMQVAWQSGMTVTDLMAAVEDGEHYIAVRVNGRLVARPHYACTPVPDGSQVYLLPLIAGG